MSKKNEANVKCPACTNPIVTIYKDKPIRGVLQHKCSKCRRHWDVDYSIRLITWVKGKESSTSIKEYPLVI